MKGTQLAADVKFALDYAKWIELEGRLEKWLDSTKRVMTMHRTNPKLLPAFQLPRFNELVDLAEELYNDKIILGSNRALQFGGAPIMKHNSKMYNCLASHASRVEFFCEAMYWLMSGCGVGYSVQYHHVEQLPPIASRTRGAKTFVIEDSIEGWSDAVGVLMTSYFHGVRRDEGDSVMDYNLYSRHYEYQGYEIKFDYSLIRPKGAEISGGFKAPGHEGLKQSIERIEELLNKRLKEQGNEFVLLKPINVYDVVCHLGDAVLSGGVRRSATICVFSPNDQEMIESKTFANYNVKAGINPQRARANNSVVLVRSETTKEMFNDILQKTKDWGEPGFYFVDHRDQVPNPCVEIGMWPIALSGRTGWQGCNLDTGNGRKITSLEMYYKMCVGLAVMGTLQATYTDFKYVSKESKEIFDREALLGCGICGWMNSPDILLNEENMRKGAQLILDINKEVVDLMRSVGIEMNYAARTTCSKPDGNTGVLLEAASGVHGEEAPFYFRNIQINKETEIAKYFNEHYPSLIEESVWSASKTDDVLWIPVEAKRDSIFKKDLIGVNQLKIVKSIQQNWVEAGTRVEACVKPFLRHNVSNTVQVENWEEVGDYLYENKDFFSGVSFLSVFGPLDYKQAPFTPVMMPQEMLDVYEDAAIFASGLIVDGLHYFNNDLWEALAMIDSKPSDLVGTREQVLLKSDWIRRAKQFAKRFLKGDLQKMNYCLKQAHLYHKWVEINRDLKKKPIDITQLILKPTFIDADTMGSASCVGGACELPSHILDQINNPKG